MKEELTNQQQTIMRCIWEAGKDISYQDLLQAVSDRLGRKCHTSTLMTFLSQLEGKRYITTYRNGRFAYVRPSITLTQYRAMRAKTEIDSWFNGSLTCFLDACRQGRGIPSEEELAEIREILASWEA